MRYLLIVYIVLFFSILASARATDCICVTKICNTQRALKDIKDLLRKKASPKAVPINDLAPAILHTAQKYHLDYRVLTAVVLVESRGVSTAYNPRTHDHGLMQLNEKTRLAMGLSIQCMYNIDCNLDAGARVLKSALKHRICVYNLGGRKIVLQRLIICERYERMVASQW